VDRPDLTQTQIRIGHEGIARSAPDWVAVTVMNYILGGGGFSSRLMDRIRVQRGYTYGISSQFAPRRSPGPFTISTFTPHAQAADAVAEIFDVVEELRASGPTDEEMDAARTFHVAGFPRHFETPSGVAAALLEAEVYGLGERELETRQDRFAAVTREEVAKAAAARLNPATPCLVLYTRAEDVAGPLRDVLSRRASSGGAAEVELKVEPAPAA
jgi:zinc protease